MKSASLVPYCPLPVDSGARSIFNKHLSFLKSLGDCHILSTARRPVGYGWEHRYKEDLISRGYQLSFSPLSPNSLFLQAYGIGYALFFKALKLEKAFGHSNPYHRHAFNADWFYDQTKGLDLCEIHYTNWVRLKTACPKVVVVHDLWSDIMWEGTEKETFELKTADLIVTVSYDDKVKLMNRGLENVSWSPPCVDEIVFSDSKEVAIVGSGNAHNVEGIDWLRKGLNNEIKDQVQINCFGALCSYLQRDKMFALHGAYDNTFSPYESCGIILMLTKEGTGVQIKGVEALASGRAIVARKGAMRGLPSEEKGWLEVDTAEEMIYAIQKVRTDNVYRKRLMERSRGYYLKYLAKNSVFSDLREKYKALSRC